MSEEKIISGYCRVLDQGRMVTVEWGRPGLLDADCCYGACVHQKALAKLARPLPPYWKRNQDKQYTRGYRVPIRGSPGCMNLRGKLRDKRIHLTFRRWGVRAIGVVPASAHRFCKYRTADRPAWAPWATAVATWGRPPVQSPAAKDRGRWWPWSRPPRSFRSP